MKQLLDILADNELHQLVTAATRVTQESETNEVSEYRAYNKCCIEALRRDLDRVPWHILEIFDDIEDSWCGWKLLFDLVFAPIKKSRKKRQHVPWITEEVQDKRSPRKESKKNQR